MTTAYFCDDATDTGIHSGHVDHEEVEITDEELRKLKGRAAKAATMDGGPGGRATPPEYQAFLDGGQGKSTYEAFLREEQTR